MSTRRRWGEIKDPIYGYIGITELDRKLIDTWPLQRLRRIRQLAGSEYVYPGASHTRFEHSLGVMHLASRLSSSSRISRSLNKVAEKIRIAALLHDIGHGPFSHVFESLLESLGKTHEDLTMWIILESEIADVLSEHGYDVGEIAKMAVGKSGNTLANQIIRSSIDVDKMDFIVRDNYHTGAGYGSVDVFRIIDSVDVIDGNLSVNVNSLSALEALLIARIESFRTVYFHRTARAAQIMLADALKKANEEIDLVDFTSVDNYLRLDDYTTWALLERCKTSKEVMEKLRRRELLKCCYDSEFYAERGIVPTVFSSSEVRGKLKSRISKLAEVPTDKVFIDVPTLPSVPYSHSIQLQPMEIPAYKESGEEKWPLKASDVSPIIKGLQVFLNILRVYSEEKHRTKVSEASKEVFGETPFSLKISY